jgi:hypothetical protein
MGREKMVTGERPRPKKNEGAEMYLKMEKMGAGDGREDPRTISAK